MKPLIHIGYPKTATTWFQQNFFPFVENIKYVSKKEINEHIIFPNSFEFNPVKEKQYFTYNNNKRILLSHENLIGAIRRGGINGYMTKELGLRLKAVFGDAKIIIFIRNQFDIISSAYFQYIRAGGTYSIGKYLHHKMFNEEFNKILLFSFKHFEYDKIIKYYEDLFGKENVYTFLYEDFANNNNEFLTRFQKTFDFKVNLNNINYIHKNDKYRTGLTKIVRFSNIFTRKRVLYKYYLLNIPYWFIYSRRLLNYLNKYKIFGRHPEALEILGKKHYSYISEYYKASNRILVNDFNLKSIEKYNYPL